MKSTTLTLLVFLLLPALHAQNHHLYISNNGNDSWNGKAANISGINNGPFKTFDRVLKELEQINQKQSTGQVIVYIRGGLYQLTKSIEILEQHAAGNITVVFKNYANEQVTITGGKEITVIEQVPDSSITKKIPLAARGRVIALNLKDNGIKDVGNITNRGRPGLELFYNNQRMEPARWPNKEWAFIKDVPQTGNLVFAGDLPHMRFGIPVGRHHGRIQYDGDRPKHWTAVEHITLHGYWTWDWFDEFLKIDAIDTSTGEISIKAPHSQYGYCKNQRYYALNVLEELDQPGEWYLDHDKQAVYFWPLPSKGVPVIIVSVLDSPLLVLRNTKNVRFENLRFSISRGNAIVISDGNNNKIAGCTFENMGDIAIRIEGGTHNGVVSSDIHDIASNGILLKGGDRKTITPGNNYVHNNHIYRTSQWVRTYQPPVTIAGVGNSITNNLIHDVPGTGILLTGNEHTIAYNDLYRLALETGDVGGFYMGRDWTERGNKILYNYFHDLNGPGVHDVNAVYLDDWASGSIIKGNIFAGCARGIMIGGGRDNTVDNNFFINCRIGIHVDARGLGWAKYYFDGTTNTLFNRMDAMNFKLPPYSVKYPELLKLYTDEPAVAKYNHIYNNVFYKGKWLDLHDKLNLSIVEVNNNVIADDNTSYSNNKDHLLNGNPGFTNPQQQDFRLNNNILRYGIKDIPLKQIGLQKDVYRVNPLQSFK